MNPETTMFIGLILGVLTTALFASLARSASQKKHEAELEAVRTYYYDIREATLKQHILEEDHECYEAYKMGWENEYHGFTTEEHERYRRLHWPQV